MLWGLRLLTAHLSKHLLGTYCVPKPCQALEPQGLVGQMRSLSWEEGRKATGERISKKIPDSDMGNEELH